MAQLPNCKSYRAASGSVPFSTEEVKSAAATHSIDFAKLREFAEKVYANPRVEQNLVTQLNVDGIEIISQTDESLWVFVDGTSLRQFLTRLFDADDKLIDALFETHKSHLMATVSVDRREPLEARLDEEATGFVLSMPCAVAFASKLHERTVLKPRESQVWALKEEGLSHKEIAGLLEVSKGTVDVLSSRIRERVERSHATAELITITNYLTRSKTDALAADYLGLDWSPWVPLDPAAGDIGNLSTDPGLYRVRHPSRDRLMYIGETGRSIRERVGGLARGTYENEMPYLDPHVGAPRLWAIRQELDGKFEVSVADPEIAADPQHRKGIEASLIAVHHREYKSRPTANFSKIIPGYEMSSYQSDNHRGGPISNKSGDVDAQLGQTPPPWDTWRPATDDGWLGQDWTPARPLKERLEIDKPTQCVYRIWDDDGSESLEYIGESTNITGQLREKEKSFGADAMFSVAPVRGLDRHERHELKLDLIGAHYLDLGQSPIEQFG